MTKIQLFDHEFNGYKIRQRSEDDFVNLTDIANAHGKRAGDYLGLPETKRYVSALAAKLFLLPDNLVIKTRGRYGSTFAHPEIAMDCAEWASMECKLWAKNTLVRCLENDVTLVTEQIERMTDINDLNLVKVVVEKRIDTVKGILTAAGLQKPSVRKKLQAVYETIKKKHRYLLDIDKGMVYISDFLDHTDNETTEALEPLLDMPGRLLIKAAGSMVYIDAEGFEQFKNRRQKEEGKVLRHDDLGDLPDFSDCFSIFFKAD